MVETGIGSREWADQIIHHMFEEPNMESEDSKDPMLMGEFEVIKELLAKHPEMKEAKTLVDKMIGTKHKSMDSEFAYSILIVLFERHLRRSSRGNRNFTSEKVNNSNKIQIRCQQRGQANCLEEDDHKLHREIFLPRLFRCICQGLLQCNVKCTFMT